jgi:hypothetical protein
LRRATRVPPSTRELFEKSSIKNFYFGSPQVYRQSKAPIAEIGTFLLLSDVNIE